MLELYPDLDVPGMEEILEQGLFNATLFGIHTEQEAAND